MSSSEYGSGVVITRPSVALRDGDLDYGILSQADLVIRVPMGGGTHVGKRRWTTTWAVARTSGSGGGPRHGRWRARREAVEYHDVGGGTEVGRGRWDGGNADHQIRTLLMWG